MNTTTTRKTNTVRIYGCGGCGVNLGSKIMHEYERVYKGRDHFAAVEICFLDTSSSNLAKLNKEYDSYLIDGLDGSGQVRSQNYQVILPRIKEIIQTFKPLDLNIVVTSLSGGSGSVFSPLLVKELLTKGEQVVVLAVGDESTKLYTTNTLNSLKSFEAISQQTGCPVIMSYFYNRGSDSKAEVDKFMMSSTFDLACLFSNQHVGLDSQDLDHFLYYNKVTDHPVGLASISVVLGREAKAVNKSLYQNLGAPVAVATLVPPGGVSDFPHAIDYHTEGDIEEELSLTLYEGEPVHFVISDGIFDKIAVDLNNRLTEIKEIKDAKIKRSSLLSDNDNIDSSGLVL